MPACRFRRFERLAVARAEFGGLAAVDQGGATGRSGEKGAAFFEGFADRRHPQGQVAVAKAVGAIGLRP